MIIMIHCDNLICLKKKVELNLKDIITNKNCNINFIRNLYKNAIENPKKMK